MPKTSFCFWLVVAGGLLMGCSSDTGKQLARVSGKVTYKESPVEGAMVIFIASESSAAASGTTNAQGEYQLTTYDTNDGAEVGEQSVVIKKLESSDSTTLSNDPEKMQQDYLKKLASAGAKGAPPRPDTKNQLPAKYSDPKKSGLRRTVVAGKPNSFSFELTD